MDFVGEALLLVSSARFSAVKLYRRRKSLSIRNKEQGLRIDNGFVPMLNNH